MLDAFEASEEVRRKAAGIRDKLSVNRLAESKSSLPVYLVDILDAYEDCVDYIEEEKVARLVIMAMFGLR